MIVTMSDRDELGSLFGDWHSHKAITRLIDLGKYDAAEKKIQELLVKNPGDVDALFWRARCCIARGRIGNAIKVLRSALSIDPENLRVNTMLAILLCEGLDVDEGLRLWKRTLELSQGDPKIKAFYADSLYRMGHLKDAEQFASEALSELPKNADVQKTYSVVFENDKSMKVVDEVLRDNPEDDEALNLKGVYLLRKGNSKKALELFQSALRVNPENSAAHKNILLAAKCNVWFYNPFFRLTCWLGDFGELQIYVFTVVSMIFFLIVIRPLGLLFVLFLMLFNLASFSAGLVAKSKFGGKYA